MDAVVVRDILEEVDGYIGMLRTVKAAQGYDEKDTPYELALRGANDGLWEWDLRKKTALWSPRWKALLSYGQGELIEDIQEWFDRIHPDDINSLKQGLIRYLLVRNRVSKATTD